MVNPIKESEILNIISAKNPDMDLRINENGCVAKRSFFSKIFYYFGYKANESDEKLKNRIGQIVDNLLLNNTAEDLWDETNRDLLLKNINKGSKSDREIDDLFLEKVGKLKSSQFDKTHFQPLFRASKRREVKEKLTQLDNTIKDMNDPEEINSAMKKTYQEVLTTLSSFEPGLRDEINNKINKDNSELNAADLKKEVRDLIRNPRLAPPEGALAKDIENQFHIKEKKAIKSEFVNLLKKTKDMDDPNEIRKEMLATYQKLTKDPFNADKSKLNEKHIKLGAIIDPKKEQLIDIIKYDVLEAKTEAKIARMNFLFKIGVSGSSEKGVTGTVLVKDLRGRVLGVFKPDAIYAPLATRIGNYVRKIFGQLSLLSGVAHAQPQAEYAAYLVDRFFGINSVPSSKLAELGGAKGVFQLAAGTAKKTRDGEAEGSVTIGKRIKEAKDVQNILNKDKYENSELEIFQKFAIHDFLIGNLDAHEENWFVDTINDKITGIIGIDKANSWPVKNPDTDDRRSKNQYKWKEMGIAQKPFTDSMKEFMKTINDDKLNEFFTQMENETPGFFNDDMKDLALQRASAIRIMAINNNSTPADLGKIISNKQFDKLFT